MGINAYQLIAAASAALMQVPVSYRYQRLHRCPPRRCTPRLRLSPGRSTALVISSCSSPMARSSDHGSRNPRPDGRGSTGEQGPHRMANADVARRVAGGRPRAWRHACCGRAITGPTFRSVLATYGLRFSPTHGEPTSWWTRSRDSSDSQRKLIGGGQSDFEIDGGLEKHAPVEASRGRTPGRSTNPKTASPWATGSTRVNLPGSTRFLLTICRFGSRRRTQLEPV